MNILITGATGFIGRYLTQKLCENKNNNIFCLVRKTSKNLKYLSPLKVRFVYTDITDSKVIDEIPNLKFDMLFHCAGYVSNKDKKKLYKINVLGTENICKLALKIDVERMVYLSSVAVVSGNEEVPLVEELPYKATNIYGESKIEAEKKVLEYRKKGLRVIILRPCMVYGENEPHLLGALLTLLKYRLFPLMDGGKSKLHLVYVKNLVEVMIFSLFKKEFLEGTFFVADGEILSVKEIFTILSQSIGVKPPLEIPRFLKPLLLNLPYVGKKLRFFLKDRIYNIDKIKSLGFCFPYSTQEALSKSARFWLERKQKRRDKSFSIDKI